MPWSREFAAMIGGYPVGAIVRHGDLQWLSAQDDNGDEPGRSGSWISFEGDC